MMAPMYQSTQLSRNMADGGRVAGCCEYFIGLLLTANLTHKLRNSQKSAKLTNKSANLTKICNLTHKLPKTKHDRHCVNIQTTVAFVQEKLHFKIPKILMQENTHSVLLTQWIRPVSLGPSQSDYCPHAQFPSGTFQDRCDRAFVILKSAEIERIWKLGEEMVAWGEAKLLCNVSARVILWRKYDTRD